MIKKQNRKIVLFKRINICRFYIYVLKKRSYKHEKSFSLRKYEFFCQGFSKFILFYFTKLNKFCMMFIFIFSQSFPHKPNYLRIKLTVAEVPFLLWNLYQTAATKEVVLCCNIVQVLYFDMVTFFT